MLGTDTFLIRAFMIRLFLLSAYCVAVSLPLCILSPHLHYITRIFRHYVV